MSRGQSIAGKSSRPNGCSKTRPSDKTSCCQSPPSSSLLVFSLPIITSYHCSSYTHKSLRTHLLDERVVQQSFGLDHSPFCPFLPRYLFPNPLANSSGQIRWDYFVCIGPSRRVCLSTKELLDGPLVLQFHPGLDHSSPLTYSHHRRDKFAEGKLFDGSVSRRKSCSTDRLFLISIRISITLLHFTHSQTRRGDFVGVELSRRNGLLAGCLSPSPSLSGLRTCCSTSRTNSSGQLRRDSVSSTSRRRCPSTDHLFPSPSRL